ncbi:MAG: cysteine dioxygenase family protein [Bacteroidota bacterium]
MMTSQIEDRLSLLVMKSFTQKDPQNIQAVKDYCLKHFTKQLDALQEKMIYSDSIYYEKEILLVNNEIEVIVSGWLPGNTCFPHDHDQAECFVFVLNGRVENTLLDFDNGRLEITHKTVKQGGDNLYLGAGIIHYMQNIGNENLICLHVYTPGISEMRVFDDQHKIIYTLSGEAGAWLPPKEKSYILEARSYSKPEVDAVII